MAIMSFAEYARHRGVSKVAVFKAIKDGRIQEVIDHDGKRRIDSEDADKKWTLNTAHHQRRGQADQMPGLESIFPAENFESGPPLPAPTVQLGFGPKALGLPEKPALVNGAPEGSYASARAFKEHYLARQAELDYRQKAGELLELDDIKKKWVNIAATVRTKILGVPSKARQRIPDLTDEQYFTLESIIREALEDLSEQGGAA